MRHGYLWRVPEELWEQIEKRAAEKGLSVNEWLVRCATHALLNRSGGTITTVTTTKEF